MLGIANALTILLEHIKSEGFEVTTQLSDSRASSSVVRQGAYSGAFARRAISGTTTCELQVALSVRVPHVRDRQEQEAANTIDTLARALTGPVLEGIDQVYPSEYSVTANGDVHEATLIVAMVFKHA